MKNVKTLNMSNWQSRNRHKYLLQYHLISVCKYRKKLLSSQKISDSIKRLSLEICSRHDIVVKYMETDKDHIHYMLETNPKLSISKIVAILKGYTTFWIWREYPLELSKEFWREHTFWTDGYFVCSVGKVSEKILKEYIENQG